MKLQQKNLKMNIREMNKKAVSKMKLVVRASIQMMMLKMKYLIKNRMRTMNSLKTKMINWNEKIICY
jgi:hypothetical protein